jgi:putative transposase
VSQKERKAMVEPDNSRISKSRQCALLGISRTSLYYRPREMPSKRDRSLMRAIDEQYLKTPYYGRRRMRLALRKKGYQVSEKKVRRLMHLMGLRAISPGPSTSSRAEDHKVYPYLLKDMRVIRPDQVWCSDITYIPIVGSFMYLCVIMDWYSRKVLSWSLSTTLDAEFCVSCLERAIGLHGRPEIFNSDQGSQYTSEGFIGVLKENGIKISMDGKGSFRDNIFIERLWRSLKYELIYMREFVSVAELREGLRLWFESYNCERFHQALEYRTPEEVYRMGMAA